MKHEAFLPQYAAQAVVDLEKMAKRVTNSGGMAGTPERPRLVDPTTMKTALQSVAYLLRNAEHVVLPANGEIYRDNFSGGSQPSEEECNSMGNLPAPITAFEYPWTHPGGDSRKRITLVVDDRQMLDGPVPDGMTLTWKMFSLFHSERMQSWALYPYAILIANPLYTVMRTPSRGVWDWSYRLSVGDVMTMQLLASDNQDIAQAVGEFRPDITAVIQCGHALRAGAALEERHETSATRRWKFEKKGVSGFSYHVLKLPAHISADVSIGGTHAGPRFHIRRAHIRKLPTGVLTFVRQCFVGDRERGIVEKHYQVQ